MNAKESLKSLCQNCYLNNDNCTCHFHAKANALNKTKDTEEFSCEEFKILTALVDEHEAMLKRAEERIEEIIDEQRELVLNSNSIYEVNDVLDIIDSITLFIRDILKGERKC